MRSYGRTLQARVKRVTERRVDELRRRSNEPFANLMRSIVEAGVEALERGEPEHVSRERIVMRLDAIELTTRAILKQLYEGTGATHEQALEELMVIDRAVRDRADERMRSGS